MKGNRTHQAFNGVQGTVLASPAIIMAGNFDINALPDAALVACLAASGRRPNVLVECPNTSADAALQHVTNLCARPVRSCELPGRLELPATKEGTLVLRDVASLTLAQQVQLYDWLSVGCGSVQVISFSARPLRDLMEDGVFLESLYYRLNVIRLDAGQSGPPVPATSVARITESAA